MPFVFTQEAVITGRRKRTYREARAGGEGGDVRLDGVGEEAELVELGVGRSNAEDSPSLRWSRHSFSVGPQLTEVAIGASLSSIREGGGMRRRERWLARGGWLTALQKRKYEEMGKGNSNCWNSIEDNSEMSVRIYSFHF